MESEEFENASDEAENDFSFINDPPSLHLSSPGAGSATNSRDSTPPIISEEQNSPQPQKKLQQQQQQNKNSYLSISLLQSSSLSSHGEENTLIGKFTNDNSINGSSKRGPGRPRKDFIPGIRSIKDTVISSSGCGRILVKRLKGGTTKIMIKKKMNDNHSSISSSSLSITTSSLSSTSLLSTTSATTTTTSAVNTSPTSSSGTTLNSTGGTTNTPGNGSSSSSANSLQDQMLYSNNSVSSPITENSSVEAFSVNENEKLSQNVEEEPYFPEKWPGKVCALCNLSERSQLGQGEMLRLKIEKDEEQTITEPISNSEDKDVALCDSSPNANVNCQVNSRRQKGLNKCKNPVNLEYIDEFEKIGYLEPVEFSSIQDGVYYYVHRLCATWSFGVHREPSGALDKIATVVAQSLKRKCAYCQHYGASLACKMSCPKFFHLPCVPSSGGLQLIQNYISFCKEHLGQISVICQDDIHCRTCSRVGDISNLLMCSICGDHFHCACIGLSQFPGVRAGWQCKSCQRCQICRVSELGEGRYLSCEQCHKIYHAHCLRPIISSIPKYGWKCRRCRICSDCGARTPGAGASSRWHAHYTICDSCYQQRNKGFSCPICQRAYRAAAYKEMVKCNWCNKFVHSSCDSEADLTVYHAKKENNPDYDYMCPPCKLQMQCGRYPSQTNRQLSENESINNSQDSSHNDTETMDGEEKSMDYGLGKGKPYIGVKLCKKGSNMSFSQLSRNKGKLPLQKRSRVSDLGRKRGPKAKIRGIFGVPGLGLQRPTADISTTGKNEDEPGVENRLVLCSAKDKFILTQDICVMCGAIGTDHEGCLIACMQCGQSYHPYCANVKVTKVILNKGWRCLDCTVCEGCGQKNDEARLILCDECDISYHTYCMDPPLEFVPQGNWKCKWCAICHKCGKNDPGKKCSWQNSYSECGPCSSQVSCPICLEEYGDGELIIQCITCERWLHGKCDSINNDEEAEKCDDYGYTCILCRPKDTPPPHLLVEKKMSISMDTSPENNLSLSNEQNELAVIQSMEGNHFIDGVYLSEHGLSLIKSLQTEYIRKKRRKLTSTDSVDTNKNAAILAAIESVVAGNEGDDVKIEHLGEKEEAEVYKEGMVWEHTDLSPPEGFAVCTNEQGVMILRKKRQRNLQKVGIGGFNVRNRAMKKDWISKDEVDEQTMAENNGLLINYIDFEKKKKPIRKRQKNKLTETYPMYLQEAFFGKSLLDKSKDSVESDSSEDNTMAANKITSDKTIELSEEEIKILNSLKKEPKPIEKPLEISTTSTPVENKDFDLSKLKTENKTEPTEDITKSLLSPDLLSSNIVDTNILNNDQLNKSTDSFDFASESSRLTTKSGGSNEILPTNFNLESIGINSKDVEDIFHDVMDTEPKKNNFPEHTKMETNFPCGVVPPHDIKVSNIENDSNHVEVERLVQIKQTLMSETIKEAELPKPQMQLHQQPQIPLNTMSNFMSPIEKETSINMTDPSPSPVSNPILNDQNRSEELLMGTPSTGSQNCAQKSSERMRRDEDLGDRATISAVLYANTHHPELKQDYPNWSDRCKQIYKRWRALSNEKKAPFLQQARDNRSAFRMKKVQQDQEKITSQQKTFKEQEQERQWKQLQAARAKEQQLQTQFQQSPREMNPENGNNLMGGVNKFANITGMSPGTPQQFSSIQNQSNDFNPVVTSYQTYHNSPVSADTSRETNNKQLRDLLQRQDSSTPSVPQAASGAMNDKIQHILSPQWQTSNGNNNNTGGILHRQSPSGNFGNFREPNSIGTYQKAPSYPQNTTSIPQESEMQMQTQMQGNTNYVEKMKTSSGITVDDKKLASSDVNVKDNLRTNENNPPLPDSNITTTGDIDKLNQEENVAISEVEGVGDIFGGLAEDDDDELLNSLTAEMGVDFNILEYADPELDTLTDNNNQNLLDKLDFDENNPEDKPKRGTAESGGHKIDNAAPQLQQYPTDINMELKARQQLHQQQQLQQHQHIQQQQLQSQSQLSQPQHQQQLPQTHPQNTQQSHQAQHLQTQSQPQPQQRPQETQQQQQQQQQQAPIQKDTSILYQSDDKQYLLAQLNSANRPMNISTMNMMKTGGNMSNINLQRCNLINPGTINKIPTSNVALPPPPYPGPPPPYPAEIKKEHQQPLLLEDLLEEEKREQMLQASCAGDKRFVSSQESNQTHSKASGGAWSKVKPEYTKSNKIGEITNKMKKSGAFTSNPNIQSPPPLPDKIVTEEDRIAQMNYEQWLNNTNNTLTSQFKIYEDEVMKLRKARKSLNSKQRVLKKAGNELSETDMMELTNVTAKQAIIQKQLENSRKQVRQHSLLIQEYKTKYINRPPLVGTPMTPNAQSMSTGIPSSMPSPSTNSQPCLVMPPNSSPLGTHMLPNRSPLQSPGPQMVQSPSAAIPQSPVHQPNSNASPYHTAQSSPRIATPHSQMDENSFGSSAISSPSSMSGHHAPPSPQITSPQHRTNLVQMQGVMPPSSPARPFTTQPSPQCQKYNNYQLLQDRGRMQNPNQQCLNQGMMSPEIHQTMQPSPSRPPSNPMRQTPDIMQSKRAMQILQQKQFLQRQTMYQNLPKLKNPHQAFLQQKQSPNPASPPLQQQQQQQHQQMQYIQHSQQQQSCIGPKSSSDPYLMETSKDSMDKGLTLDNQDISALTSNNEINYGSMGNVNKNLVGGGGGGIPNLTENFLPLPERVRPVRIKLGLFGGSPMWNITSLKSSNKMESNKQTQAGGSDQKISSGEKSNSNDSLQKEEVTYDEKCNESILKSATSLLEPTSTSSLIDGSPEKQLMDYDDFQDKEFISTEVSLNSVAQTIDDIAVIESFASSALTDIVSSPLDSEVAEEYVLFSSDVVDYGDINDSLKMTSSLSSQKLEDDSHSSLLESNREKEEKSVSIQSSMETRSADDVNMQKSITITPIEQKPQPITVMTASSSQTSTADIIKTVLIKTENSDKIENSVTMNKEKKLNEPKIEQIEISKGNYIQGKVFSSTGVVSCNRITFTTTTSSGNTTQVTSSPAVIVAPKKVVTDTAKVSIGNTTISVPVLKPLNTTHKLIGDKQGKMTSNISVTKQPTILNVRAHKLNPATIVSLSSLQIKPVSNSKLVQATVVSKKLPFPQTTVESITSVKPNVLHTLGYSKLSSLTVLQDPPLPNKIFEDEPMSPENSTNDNEEDRNENKTGATTSTSVGTSTATLTPITSMATATVVKGTTVKLPDNITFVKTSDTNMLNKSSATIMKISAISTEKLVEDASNIANKYKEKSQIRQTISTAPQLSPLSRPTEMTTNLANVSQQLRTIMSSIGNANAIHLETKSKDTTNSEHPNEQPKTYTSNSEEQNKGEVLKRLTETKPITITLVDDNFNKNKTSTTVRGSSESLTNLQKSEAQNIEITKISVTSVSSQPILHVSSISTSSMTPTSITSSVGTPVTVVSHISNSSNNLSGEEHKTTNSGGSNSNLPYLKRSKSTDGGIKRELPAQISGTKRYSLELASSLLASTSQSSRESTSTFTDESSIKTSNKEQTSSITGGGITITSSSSSTLTMNKSINSLNTNSNISCNNSSITTCHQGSHKQDETQNVLLKQLLQNTCNTGTPSQVLPGRKVPALRAPSLGVVSSLEAQLARPVLPPVPTNTASPLLQKNQHILQSNFSKDMKTPTETRKSTTQLISKETSFVSSNILKDSSSTTSSQEDVQKPPEKQPPSYEQSIAASNNSGNIPSEKTSVDNGTNISSLSSKLLSEDFKTHPSTGNLLLSTKDDTKDFQKPINSQSGVPIDENKPTITTSTQSDDNGKISTASSISTSSTSLGLISTNSSSFPVTLSGTTLTENTTTRPSSQISDTSIADSVTEETNKDVKMKTSLDTDSNNSSDLKKKRKREHQKSKKQLLNKDVLYTKKRSRKLVKLDEDYDSFIDNLMQHLRNMSSLQVLEPLLNRNYGVCPPFGAGDLSKLSGNATSNKEYQNNILSDSGSYGNVKSTNIMDFYNIKPYGYLDPQINDQPTDIQNGFYDQEFPLIKFDNNNDEYTRLENIFKDREIDTPGSIVSSSSPECALNSNCSSGSNNYYNSNNNRSYSSCSNTPFPGLKLIKHQQNEPEEDCYSRMSPIVPLIVPKPIKLQTGIDLSSDRSFADYKNAIYQANNNNNIISNSNNWKKRIDNDLVKPKDSNMTVTLTLTSSAAEDIMGVLRDLANILRIPPPTTYQIVERTSTPPSQKLGLYKIKGKDGKEGDPIDIQTILNGAAKFCRHCDVIILNTIIRAKASEFPLLVTKEFMNDDDDLYFCSKSCYKQFKWRPTSIIEDQNTADSEKNLIDALNTSDLNSLSQSSMIGGNSFSDDGNSIMLDDVNGFKQKSQQHQDNQKQNSKQKSLQKQNSLESSSDNSSMTPTKKCIRFRHFSKDTFQSTFKFKKPTEKEITELLFKMNITVTPPNRNSEDTRLCIFCNQCGDGVADGPSRLLNFDVDKWVHLNCALWSDGVYETVNGGLMNLEAALQASLNQTCSVCRRLGATIKCFKNRCGSIYHLMCAVKDKCVFYKNKTTHCQIHALKTEKENELTTLSVQRRVYVERDESRQVAAVMHHSELNNLLRVGSLTFLSVGQLLPHQLQAFHSPTCIYPIGYKIIRFYWSMKRPNKRCRYICSIVDVGGRPEFRIIVQEPSEEDVEFRDSTPKGVWQKILEPIATVRKDNDLVQLFPKYITGEDLFGLTEPAVVRILESLPGVETLTDYRFKYGRNPLLELPLAINPSGAARTEPKQKQAVGWKKSHTQRSGSTNQRLPLTPTLSVAGEVACPYSKQFVHSKSSQYKKMKQEWRNNVYLARSKIQGLGLYAARDLEKHTMVIEYIGEVIRTEVSELREKQYEAKNRGIYMFRLDEDRVVDATLCGGLARYINHSCNPNCVTEIVEVDREYRIIIFAKRRINRGEELSYDYKFDIEDDAHKISCMCGAPNCRKWMN